jgi:tetratricopeptide (TPR) repeat protein
MSLTRISAVLLFLFVLFVPASRAQLGKNVSVPAGSEADKQLNAILSAEPSQKLPLIDAFSQANATGDLQIVADEQYVLYYLNAKQYDKVFEYGDKLFALDPDNYGNALNMVRAASEKGDGDHLFQYGEKANAIVEKYKAARAPAGANADEWAKNKADKLASIKEDQDYIRQALLNGAYNAKDPAKRADYFVRFTKLYPDVPESEQALTMAASAYQQAQNRPKMEEVANTALAKDPNDIGILLLLADDYSEKGDQLDKASEYAKKASMLTDTAKKPDNVTDQQWQQQTTIQKGLALSILGQINLQRKQNTQAVDSLSKAAPLLKSNTSLYARNEYRLGLFESETKRRCDESLH